MGIKRYGGYSWGDTSGRDKQRRGMTESQRLKELRKFKRKNTIWYKTKKFIRKIFK